jgi:hypothetical protein
MTVGDGFDLDQSLIVAPEAGFAAVAAAMDAIGLTRTRDAGGASLIPGEPELASWSRRGQKPFVTYTLNPVAMLRVLDVGTAPPALRAEIAARLRLLSHDDVAALLDAADTREVLRGLWAARETQRIDLLECAQNLAGAGSGLLAEQGRAVAADLASVAEAQQTALVTLRSLAMSAEPIIARLHDPGFTRGLRPDRDACAALFDTDLAEPIAAAAAELFADPPTMDAPNESPDTTAATAGALRWPNVLSYAFPRGYRNIAGWMTPQRVWLTWATRSASGGVGTRYDGLAWIGDRWVWLPKPFRIVAPLVSGP